MRMDGKYEVLIVGGGASGALMAAHLLRQAEQDLRVTIVERSSATGLGLAYGTVNPDHLLNVRASNMSAFPDQPDHFWDWMVANDLDTAPGCSDAFCFVPRATYGRYLASLVERHLAGVSGAGRLRIVRNECTALAPAPDGVTATLWDGSAVYGHVAIIATGNEAPAPAFAPHSVNPWVDPAAAGVKTDDTVLIIGSGLTMVDYVLSLLRAGHRGSILAMSRRGLLPHAHRQTTPLRIDPAVVSFGTDISHFLGWLRALVRSQADPQRDWRAVVDGLRPFTQQIWQRWPQSARRRFLRHARAWWDVHRHRMAPDVERRLRRAVAERQLTVLAAKIVGVETAARGAIVSYRRRGAAAIESVRVDKIAECVGVSVRPQESVNPLLRNVMRTGLARPDAIDLGLDVSSQCAVIGRSEKASPHLFALGPLTRGIFWEVVAIPDIRIQCANVAAQILQRVQTRKKRLAV